MPAWEWRTQCRVTYSASSKLPHNHHYSSTAVTFVLHRARQKAASPRLWTLSLWSPQSMNCLTRTDVSGPRCVHRLRCKNGSLDHHIGNQRSHSALAFSRGSTTRHTRSLRSSGATRLPFRLDPRHREMPCPDYDETSPTPSSRSWF